MPDWDGPKRPAAGSPSPMRPTGRFDHRVMDSFAVANELLLVNLAYYPERVAERRRLADEELNLQRRGAGAFTGEVPPLGIGRQWLRVLEGEWDEASRLMEPGPRGIRRGRAHAIRRMHAGRNSAQPGRAREGLAPRLRGLAARGQHRARR